MRILVCGGRNYSNSETVFAVLDRIHSKHPVKILIHGAAPGADSLAELWAKDRQVPYIGVPAEWKKLGNAAGPVRNEAMLNLWPNWVIAFPGGPGTADMVRRAREANVDAFLVCADGKITRAG